MQNILKNKIFIGTLCLLMAGVLSFILLPRLYADKNTVTSVVVLNQTIEEGTAITEEMLKTIEVGALGLPTDVAKSSEQLIGKVATATIYKDEYLAENRLISFEDYKKEIAITEEGTVLLTLKLPSTSSGVAGVLQNGALVDVYTTDETDTGELETQKVFSEILVKQVLNAKLESMDTLKNQENIDGVSDDLIPYYIVVQVEEVQAKTLITLEKKESFHLTLAKAGE